MSIDWASVNWVYVGVLTVFVFVSSLVGSLVAFRHHVLGGVLSAILFAVAFVFWTYYPHNVPLPTQLTEKAVVEPAPAPATPARPAAPQEPAVPQQPASPTQDGTTPQPNQ